MNLQQEIEKLKRSSSWKKGEKHFNVFTTLLKNSDEVYLHSRFITSLLDPNGTMKMGHRPLEIFMKCLKSEFECGENTIITPNCSNRTEEGDIDILIEDTEKNFAIIIENKIYSGDNNSDPQCGQLQKYFWQVQNAMLRQKGEIKRKRENNHKYPPERIEVYYLTPNLHAPLPSSTSCGQQEDGYTDLKDKVKCIGYGEGQVITKWLKLLQKEKNCCAFAKTAIEQYLEVIKELVGDIGLNEKISNLVSTHFDEVKEMKYEILKELLGDRFIDVHWHSIASFMDNLGNELQQLKIEVEGRSSHLAITDLLYHPNKHTPIYFRIKQNGIVWTLQADDRCREKGFFLGVDTKQKGLSFNNHENQDNGWYFRRYYPGESLNLFNFPFNLLNKTEREKIARQYAAFVKQELKNFEEVNS